MVEQEDAVHISFDSEAVDGTPLVQHVAEQLRTMIMNGELAPEAQLPNEPELASQLQVSRATIRSALIILEQGGYLLRRRGIGTFVAKNPPTFKNLNVNSGVTQLIRSSGAQPGSAEILLSVRPASDHVAYRLDLKAETLVIVVERVRLADERRVVFAVDTLPRSLFHLSEKEIPLEEIDAYLRENESMYAYLRTELSLEVHHGIAWIRPLTAESYIAEKLQVPRNSSILHIEQVDYAGDGTPIALSDEYYVADAFTFSVYRSS